MFFTSTFIADGRDLRLMILGYVNIEGRYTSPFEQERAICSYADCYNLTIGKLLKTKALTGTLPIFLKQGDDLIVADISAIGERFEEKPFSVLKLNRFLYDRNLEV